MKTRTRKTAKRDSMIVWDYLRKHPEIKSKEELPKYIFKLIIDDICLCPLCSIYRVKKEPCKGCPLVINKIKCCEYNNFHDKYGLYVQWNKAITDQERSEAADKIYKLIKAWRIR